MATITFNYAPNYEQKQSEVRLIEPSLEYRVEIPDGALFQLQVEDVYYHVNNWLRGLGYVISE